jgi:hypothetical protein
MEEITSRHLEFLVAVGDAVPARDPGEIGVGNPRPDRRAAITPP